MDAYLQGVWVGLYSDDLTIEVDDLCHEHAGQPDVRSCINHCCWPVVWQVWCQQLCEVEVRLAEKLHIRKW